MNTEPDTDPTSPTPEPPAIEPPTIDGAIIVTPSYSVSSDDGGAGSHPLGFVLTKDGVELSEDQTPAQYFEGLKYWRHVTRTSKIGLSEYVRKGKIKHGEEVVEAMLVQTEFDLPLIKAAKLIATVPQEIRHENLNADHLAILAKAEVTPAKRARIAKAASEQKLSPTQLKALVETGEATDTKSRSSGVSSAHGVRMDFDIWLRRVNGVEGVLLMSPEAQDEILSEFGAIHSFVNQLIAARASGPVKTIKKLPKQSKAKAKRSKKG